MKILFCSQCNLTRSLGGAKVLLELGEELSKLGWECQAISPLDINSAQGTKLTWAARLQQYPAFLRQYLQEHAAEYDVIDYDHEYLPYSRSEFHRQTLFVARSVLLLHHFSKIQIPQERTWKSKLHSLIKKNDDNYFDKRIKAAHLTMCEADIINVSNDKDYDELVQSGIAKEKIHILPFGISNIRRPLFDGISSSLPTNPIVAFVGTFDPRKGSVEFSEIVKAISTQIPQVKFRLLGTAGLYQTKAEVLSQFPTHLRNKLEVIPHFSPEALPNLLASCSVGIFPSYIEGFPFGVLEMLAASIPVIAYNSPGPPMMLPPEYLVPCGDSTSMSEKVIHLLSNKDNLTNARIWAKQHSQQFSWQKVAERTSQIYLEQWHKRQVTGNYTLLNISS
jgi:glycosyltransferase involved in cell wall biosynthesis